MKIFCYFQTMGHLIFKQFQTIGQLIFKQWDIFQEFQLGRIASSKIPKKQFPSAFQLTARQNGKKHEKIIKKERA